MNFLTSHDGRLFIVSADRTVLFGKEEHMLRVVNCGNVPRTAAQNTAYCVRPKKRADSEAFYRERTDRNIGWITREEQEFLRTRTVGIAGCGGMGGLLASIFVRLGIGEIRLADNEAFDVSNINRQFAARESTIGKSKALETAREARRIADDCTLVVYPQGIAEETVECFLDGCDVVCDEIEVLAVPARLLLHGRARARGISLFNCNTPGFGAYLFLYTPQSMTMEEAAGLSYEEACRLSRAAEAGDQEAADRIVDAMLGAVVPAIPEYSREEGANRATFERRLRKERKVPIIATNPPFAAAFLADRILLYLLANSGVERTIAPTPVMPGYLYVDAALMQAQIIEKGWLPHGAHTSS